ncbi:MAG: ABC transporter [Candidatus Lambdaproteobacteria bacterium RIFOXYD1_FULL_56_27]|uniref:ABC transporter n=1 Tax=Candidatus Lambdaproteobacteria bacterium RIFOXYD2_FULL_56_26 TaxID=1817773 RepID=A0A1F6GZ92_9PROT|nr:MAG: ABC transporter [Candidatus Lambdaproteobacteria bacterium RIFOXYC1_FULL_56_13]OGH03392.1 MAG: ABC transporter [Candidatus Lambdaproteobacteria bacterium RIFOXYD2_FULL_56_26]OGH06603.1 MAG: ABC transporter [Candidatus Lambdaproteobacteria bacterium RIFOXYD1_FULL_56_27]
MATEALIQAKGLDKIYPVGDQQFYALSQVDFTLGAGEFTGLVGPSGSGKTTLLNLVGVLDQPSHGDLEVFGRSAARLSAQEAASLRAQSIGFIFQSYNLLPVYTVFENVELPLLLLGHPASQRRKWVAEALEWVGMSEKSRERPSRLSGGQAQRVAIARAMVKRPSLVLADEPTANLDSENSHLILSTLAKINRETGASFLFSTHDPKVIGYLRRQVSLKDGRIESDRWLGEPGQTKG